MIVGTVNGSHRSQWFYALVMFSITYLDHVYDLYAEMIRRLVIQHRCGHMARETCRMVLPSETSLTAEASAPSSSRLLGLSAPIARHTRSGSLGLRGQTDSQRTHIYSPESSKDPIFLLLADSDMVAIVLWGISDFLWLLDSILRNFGATAGSKANKPAINRVTGKNGETERHFAALLVARLCQTDSELSGLPTYPAKASKMPCPKLTI